MDTKTSQPKQFELYQQETFRISKAKKLSRILTNGSFCWYQYQWKDLIDQDKIRWIYLRLIIDSKVFNNKEQG